MRAMTRVAILIGLAVFFGIGAVLLVVSGEVKLSRNAAQVLGVDSIANFQATIYAIGCGIMSMICLVGGFVIATLDEISRGGE